MITKLKQKFIENIRQEVKILWWLAVLTLVFAASISSNLISNSMAAGITCASEATLKNWICICKDPQKLYQWWACVIDPVNVCPPDSTPKWKSCVCNDKNLIYRDKICTVDLETQCENEWWSYINQWCDFSQKNHWSAEIEVVTKAPLEGKSTINTIIDEISGKLKILDLNALTNYGDHVTTDQINISTEKSIEILPIVNTDAIPTAPAVIHDNIWVYVS